MSFLKSLFGKKPAPAKKKDSAADEVGTTLEDDSPPASGKEISAQSSPKEVMQYVFQQFASRTSRDQLRADLVQRGYSLIATGGTWKYLRSQGFYCEHVNKVMEGRPHIVDMIKNGEITLIVNTTEGKQAILESLSIRAEAVRRNVTYYTTLGAALATCRAI